MEKRKPEPDPATLWIFGFILAAVVVLVIMLMFAPGAKSEEYSQIDVKNASYCTLYSREMVLYDILHGDPIVADSDYILDRAKTHYQDCLSILPALLPLPEDYGKLQPWIVDMRDLLILIYSQKVTTIGTVPAKENPKDEEWRRQCRAEYSTWDEETGTVIRRGNPERVRCPCGGEVQCVY